MTILSKKLDAIIRSKEELIEMHDVLERLHKDSEHILEKAQASHQLGETKETKIWIEKATESKKLIDQQIQRIEAKKLALKQMLDGAVVSATLKLFKDKQAKVEKEPRPSKVSFNKKI